MSETKSPLIFLPEGVSAGQISDGYHTFDELYQHRCLLFIALMKAYPSLSWKSLKHEDGSSLEGWFIAGMHLPTGDITYHLPMEMWDMASNIQTFDTAPEWDGHDSGNVCDRLQAWISS